MTNPCCKHINKDRGPLLDADTGKPIVGATSFLGDDYPADIKGDFAEFDKADVEVLLSLYDSTEGAGNELDTGDIGSSFGAIAGKDYYMSSEMRCYLCRRQTQFMLPGAKEQSLLDFFEANLEDEAAAIKFKKELNCEQFGLATYRQKPYNVLSCTTDGHGNCKGYENKAYGLMAKGACNTEKPWQTKTEAQKKALKEVQEKVAAAKSCKKQEDCPTGFSCRGAGNAPCHSGMIAAGIDCKCV